MNTNQYNELRSQFYQQVPDFWADLFDMEYSLYHHLPITNDKLGEIVLAAERIHTIFTKAIAFIRNLPDTSLRNLGFPESALPFIRMKTIFPDYVIGRLDLVVSGSEIKLLEFNSDTPTFIKECFSVNQLVCAHFGEKSPNEGQEKRLAATIKQALDSSYQYLEIDRPARVVFAAHHLHEEDWLTSKYLQQISGIECDLVSLEQLRINDEGLYTDDGVRIDILYRQTFPIEHLLNDHDEETGDPIGIELLNLVKEKKLAIINPPSAFLLQTKALQAYIWKMVESNHPYFTVGEREWIHKYFLPTYLTPSAFSGKSTYVKKPSFGREGDSIQIFSATHEEVTRNKYKTYENELPIYQQFVELPTLNLQTSVGEENLSYMFGCFLLAGLPSAIGVRAGGQITGNESYYLPVSLKDIN